MRYDFESPDIEQQAYILERRGYQLGWVGESQRPSMPSWEQARMDWAADKPVFLPELLKPHLHNETQHIEQTHQLKKQVLDGMYCSDLLAQSPYAERLPPHFDMLAGCHDEGDPQEIEKIYFDALSDHRIVAKDLWIKASWLSYHENDASLRFRFSFGMEGMDDVSTDIHRQHIAGQLEECIFPESSIITHNQSLIQQLAQVLACDDVAFGERIVYFNAPNGGAQFHHDVERSHAGVIYAQISGASFWLALPKPALMDEICTFLSQQDAGKWCDLRDLSADREALSQYMDAFDHELVEALIDRIPSFIQYLIEKGCGYILHAGDVLLMPQRDLESCVWHSVFCLGDQTGEGLSFAMRTNGLEPS